MLMLENLTTWNSSCD